MKRATVISVAVTTVFYMLCGCMGYAAFGDAAPGNLLTGFGFYNPFWLLDIANAAIAVHLVGAYQVNFVNSFNEKMPIESESQLFSILTNLFKNRYTANLSLHSLRSGLTKNGQRTNSSRKISPSPCHRPSHSTLTCFG